MLMREVRLTLSRLHPAQREVMQSHARFNVLACGVSGRRWGKTQLGINLIAQTMLAGEPAEWFAATNKLQAEAWRDVVRVLSPVTKRVSQQEHRLELITGGTLDMWSLEATGAGRGRKAARAVIDEADYARDLETDWNEAIRPTLADYQGDAWFLSTPNGRRYFWTLYMRGQDASVEEWASWQMPTRTNPYIHPDEIEAARRELPERAFLQEFEAEFIEDGAGVFRRVQEAATATEQSEPIDGHEYVIGVDWGKHDDFTVLSVIDATIGAQATMERFNQIDYRFQRRRLRELYERFRPFVVIPERNSIGEPLIEELIADDMPVRAFTTTNASKAEAVEALSLALERGDLTILDNPTQKAELLSYEAERLPSGMLRYTAPPGMHDDCVMALALAYHGAKRANIGASVVT